MIEQNAIYTLVMCIIVTTIIIKQCLLKSKILKYRLFLGFFLIFIVSGILFFINEINKEELYVDITFYTLIGIDALCLIIIYQSLMVNVTQKNFVKQVTDYLDGSKIYCIIDNKGKIKEISSVFAELFNKSKEELINSRYFDMVEQSFQIIRFNKEDCDNEFVKQYYKEYQVKISTNQKEKREFTIKTNDNSEKILNIMETPIFDSSKYKGRFMVGDIVDKEDFLNIEKELNNKYDELDNVKLKFISYLEITSESVFFKNLDKSRIWINDNLVETLKLEDNDISIRDFNSHIHTEDLASYNLILSELTPKDPTYEITYRYNLGSHYEVIKERGKRVFENKNANEIIGNITLVNTRHFEKSEIGALDELLSYNDLLAKVTILLEENKLFEVVSVKIHNIPLINEEFGRDIGNLFLGNYISMIKNNLLSDNSNIFRISGLEFVFLITDTRKMEKLKLALKNDEKILHLPCTYCSIKKTIEANMGIAISTDTTLGAKELINCSLRTLKFSQLDKYLANYAFYKDIKLEIK